jgi:hypothetical protein
MKVDIQRDAGMLAWELDEEQSRKVSHILLRLHLTNSEGENC